VKSFAFFSEGKGSLMRHTSPIAACAAAVLLSACVVTAEQPSMDIAHDVRQIETVLMTQQDAWNRGDIPGFMQGYWQSDELRFASGGNVTTGWQATLDRYLESYAGEGKMGQLTFSDLEIEVTGPIDGLVFGKWELEREGDKPWGLFTLHFRKIGENGWVIVSDHTSSGS
tara:strand:+ start:19072 stop:19581 length:510 start_codon:yes stop_codon:yes gene_type:complete